MTTMQITPMIVCNSCDYLGTNQHGNHHCCYGDVVPELTTFRDHGGTLLILARADCPGLVPKASNTGGGSGSGGYELTA